jgi:hypothetical protein
MSVYEKSANPTNAELGIGSQPTNLPVEALFGGDLAEERICIEFMTSDRKLKASREGSK